MNNPDGRGNAHRLASIAGVTACLLGFVTAQPTPVNAQQTETVSGLVLSASDSLPLAGVRVRVMGATAQSESDSNGRFVLRGVRLGALRLLFDRIGIAPDTLDLPQPSRGIVVYLRPRAVVVRPLVATAASAARERFETQAQTSTVSLDAVDIVNAPTLLEPDVVRVTQLLPGTVAKNDFTTALNVRGGESDQNLVRLDAITVFNPFHLGGVFSTFDPAAVDRVDFVTGGFPAGFGGRLSSVLDIKLRTGKSGDVDVHGGVSLLSSKLLIEGPVFGTGATFLIGARRTYADAFTDSFTEDDPFSYYFGDILAKASAPLPTGGRVTATAYWGRDDLSVPWVDQEPGQQGVDLEFDWGNRLVGITLRQPLGALDWEQHLSISEFSTQLGLVPDVFQIANSVRLLSASANLRLSPGRQHDLRFGLGIEDYEIDYSHESEALATSSLNLTYRPTIWSVFLDDQWHPLEWLFLRPGIRLEHVLGGADFTAVAPRVAVKAFVTPTLALTGSAGRYYQAIHSIRDQEIPVTLFDFWISADDVTPVARSDHLVVGVERWFGANVSVTVEGYRKRFDNLVLQNFRDDPKTRGDEFIRATGDSHGVDLLLRKYRGRINGWISYGYNKTIRHAEDLTFAPAHDRRHTLNIVVQAPGPFGSVMGIRWGYGSPLPYTGIIGQWLHREYNADLHMFDQFEDEAISTTINAERFPHYSRLDLGFRWEFHKWGATWRPFLQLVNVYDRRNVWFYTFEYDRAPPVRTGFAQLPIFPSIGLEFEW